MFNKRAGSKQSHPTNWDQYLPVPQLSDKQALALVFTVALCTFGLSCDGDFVFDDNEAILTNKDVTNLDRDVWRLFENDFWGNRLNSTTSHKSYRPLTVLSFRFQHLVAGSLKSCDFHLTNIFLHCLVTCLIYVFSNTIFSDGASGHVDRSSAAWRTLGWFGPYRQAALTCSLLFALHPIHTESVAGLVGRADLLCAITFLLSILLYITSCHCGSSESPVYLLLSMAVCMVSVLFKEQGITAIGICSAYDVIAACRIHFRSLLQLHDKKKDYIPDSNANQPSQKNHMKSSGPPSWLRSFLGRQTVLLLCGVLILTTRWRVMGSTTPTFQPMDNPHSFVDGTVLRTLNYHYLYALNLVLLLWPYWLCFDWSMGCVPVLDWSDSRLVVVVMFWLLMTTLAWTVLQLKPSPLYRHLSMSMALLIVPFLPASNVFFRVGFVIAERNLYLPSIGYCLLATVGLALLTSKYQQHRRVIGAVFYTVLALFLFQSARRSVIWSQEVTLFESGLDVCPLNAKVHYNVGKMSADRGDTAKAIEEYREALRLFSDYDQPMNNLANIYKDQGRITEAEQLLERAVKISPNFAAAWMNLGIAQASLSKYDSAEKSYKTALTKRKNYPDCYYNLGNLYVDRDAKSAMLALSAWEQATSLHPKHELAWSNTVVLLDQLKRYEEAERIAEEAMRHLPNSPVLYHQLANIHGIQNKFEKSEKNFLRAIQLQPSAQYHTNLGILYHRWEKFTKAISSYRQALKLDPNNTSARKYMDQLQRKMQKR